MKTIKYILSVTLFAACASCNGFDDMNTNPDTITQVTAPMLATPLLVEMIDAPRGDNGIGFVNDNLLMKQVAWGEKVRDYAYNRIGRTGFSVYHSLIDAKKMEESATAFDKESFQALASFIKAYKLFYLSMSVGEIPYSDALGGETGNIKPVYDTQEKVMLQVLQDLDKASALFAAGRNFGGDPVLGGNVDKWQRVVNAFELKVLMYLSKQENNTTLNVKKRFADIVSGGKLMRNNSDNFQLIYSNKSNQTSPLYNASLADYPIMSDFMVNMLKKYNDYRLFYYAEPAEKKLNDGYNEDEWDSFLGVNPVAEITEITAAYTKGECSWINTRYKEAAGEPYIRIGYAEQNFILAEAALRGWISGSAETYYNEGIKAAMTFTGTSTPDKLKYHKGRKLTDSYIASYCNSLVVKLSGSFNEMLEKIMDQKYIAYFLQHQYDAFYEYRRTGLPKIPINPLTNLNSNKNRMPVRWMYPEKEYTTNKENVEAAVERQFGGTETEDEIMWILK